MILVETELTYQCPGEVGKISSAVHRARLAAGFQKCRGCSHQEGGSAPIATIGSATKVATSEALELHVDEHRLRGIYLRPLTPAIVLDVLAGPLASLWSQTVRTIQPDGKHVRQNLYRPSVAVSCDLRLPSLEIYRELLEGLRRTGCHVVEFGTLPEAQFCFGIQHHNLSAGIYVTGNGSGPACSGFNLYAEHGLPWGIEPRLDSDRDFSRVTRTAGATRQERVGLSYETHVRKYFYGLRPLRVFVGVCDASMQQTLERLFERLPCTLITQIVPEWREAYSSEVAARVQAERCDLGLALGEDGGRCQLVDELGQVVSNAGLLRLVSQSLLQEQPASTLWVRGALMEPRLLSDGGAGQIEGELSQAAARLHAQRGGAALLEDGSIWYFDQHPRCDAVLSLAWVLKSLSLADTPLSEVIAGW